MGTNSEYYTDVHREAVAFVNGLLTDAADRYADARQAYVELLHRPEKALHERQITFHDEVVSLLRTAAKVVCADSTAAVAGILGEQYADHMALANPVEEATP